ncbi:MAG: hypothetical protein KDD82_21945 [Planctomycetes bacterium]|nr:hypothetical protein [Planctomycetota bacterium]
MAHPIPHASTPPEDAVQAHVVSRGCANHPAQLMSRSCSACHRPLCDACVTVTDTPIFQRAFLFRSYRGIFAYCATPCRAMREQSALYERTRSLHLKLALGLGALGLLALVIPLILLAVATVTLR